MSPPSRQQSSRWRPTPSLLIALLALAVALSGTAFAATKIGTQDLKNNSVTTKKIKKKAVTTKRLANKVVTNKKVRTDSIGSGKLSDVGVFGDSFVKATATNGIDEASARAAAPEVKLFTKGPLSVTYKCFHDTTTNITHIEIYGKTTEANSILNGDSDLWGGGGAPGYLNPDTDLLARRLDSRNTSGAVSDVGYSEDEYALGAADGTSLIGGLVKAAKTGNLAGGNGPYGDGNVCLVQGYALG